MLFDAQTYIDRRNTLKQLVKSGVILLLGHKNSSINFASEIYPFRQDSSFLYYFGHNLPDLAGIIDIDNNETIFFGEDPDPSDLIWTGVQPAVADLAFQIGVSKYNKLSTLQEFIKNITHQKRLLHIIPAYRIDTLLQLSTLLDVSLKEAGGKASEILIQSIVEQRSSKTQEEIAEIKQAINVSEIMYGKVKKIIKEGMCEYDILSEFTNIAIQNQTRFSFTPTITVHGEFLHYHYYHNKLDNKQLILIDSGVESANYYASDITRTYPVSGKLTSQQQSVYQIVLDAQLRAINLIKPGVSYKNIHLDAAKTIFNGLKNIGLTKGDTETAVEQGAFALFYPHGIGHMLGLDVHDMRGLGDYAPGYDGKFVPTQKLGLSMLRLARELKENFVFTVEPGIYFVPMLIEQWEQSNKFKEFINYSELKHFRNFGGIRIEDDILVTKDGGEVLSAKIDK